ncbi:MAG: hypothetical protein NZL99_06535 [Burkholderiaceae bacterium]|nr:hypothetical protein [Burkholderiaceae bacterium]MCX8004070.1 hypothetical protein [Burkholderiaceae bacterium]
MIDERSVYAKTPKGVAEVAARSGALSLSARRVLIMIDGRRSVADLAALARPGEIAQIIETLESQGFVQRVGASAPTPAPAEPPPADAGGDDMAEERLAASLEAIKRRTVRELSDRLGPDAEVMAVRIEQCRTPEELRQRLQEAERLVAGILGAAQAQEFLRALRRR